MFFCYACSGSDSKESACNAGDPGLIPGLGRSPGEGTCYPLQYSSLQKSKGRGAWQATVHGHKDSEWLTLSLHFLLCPNSFQSLLWFDKRWWWLYLSMLNICLALLSHPPLPLSFPFPIFLKSIFYFLTEAKIYQFFFFFFSPLFWKRRQRNTRQVAFIWSSKYCVISLILYI